MKNKKWMGAVAGALVAGLAAAWWAKRRKSQNAESAA